MAYGELSIQDTSNVWGADTSKTTEQTVLHLSYASLGATTPKEAALGIHTNNPSACVDPYSEQRC